MESTHPLDPLFSTRLIEAVNAALADPSDPAGWPAADAALREGETIDGVDSIGVSALHWAAQNKDAAAIGELLKRGANPNQATVIEGSTPLHFCGFLLEGDKGEAAVACIRALREAGADPNQRDGSGSPPLVEFFMSQPLACAQALAASGARLDALDASGANFAHHWARGREPSGAEFLDALRQLDWAMETARAQGGCIDLNALDARGLSPLGAAVQAARPRMVAALAERGADLLRAAAPETLAPLWQKFGFLARLLPGPERELAAAIADRAQLREALAGAQPPARARSPRL